MKHLLKLSDLSPEELHHILDVADRLKAEQKAGGTAPLLHGRSVALMFSKNSTRTRTSFEVGVYQLGGLGNYMNAATELQSGRGEPLKDTARVLGRYYDCVVWRTYRQCDLEEFAELAGVPVINGLTDFCHPCQVLADLMTIREKFGSFSGLKMCFIGDGNNMANSLMIGCAKLGMHFVASGPEGYFPDPALIARCEAIAAETGATLAFETDPAKAVAGADVLYTDVWVSMGEPMEAWAERLEKMLPYQVNQKLMDAAGEKALFMHCLPAFHDLNTGIGRQIGEQFHLEALEVTDEVFEGPRSIVFDEAENRMHTIKAVLAATLAN